MSDCTHEGFNEETMDYCPDCGVIDTEIKQSFLTSRIDALEKVAEATDKWFRSNVIDPTERAREFANVLKALRKAGYGEVE